MAGCKQSTTRRPSRNILTADEFHEALHRDLGKSYDRSSSGPNHRTRYPGAPAPPRTRSHDLEWATARVNPRIGHIGVNLAIKFQNAGVADDTEFQRLKSLAKAGINRFWSKSIKVGKQQFCVKVTVSNRGGPNALPINIMVDEDSSNPKRSRNSGLTFLTARVVHAPAYYGFPDKEFQIDAAHEMGHSILLNAGGIGLSWTHKGTSHIWQQPKGSAPVYPESEPIDLMKYYNGRERVQLRFKRSKATERDVKRLVWGAQFQWLP